MNDSSKNTPVPKPSLRAVERLRAAVSLWPPSPGGVCTLLAVAATYFATARLGLLLAMPGGNVTPVWPPSGFALAGMLVLGRRIWPGIWLGSFTANLWSFILTGGGAPLGAAIVTAAGIGAGGTLAAWIGATWIRRFAGAGNPIERIRDVCAFMGFGGLIACLFSASNGVTWLAAGGLAPSSIRGSIWLTWWLGDTAAVFVFAPLLVAWCVPPTFPRRRRWAEACACFALLLAAGYSTFVCDPAHWFSGGHFAFLIIPFLVWPALRLGQRGAATATLAVACMAVWGTIHGRGPFVLSTRNESLLVLELFLSVVALSGLCVAAGASGQSRAETERKIVLDELESRVRERTASLIAEITERKHAEAALRASEELHRSLIETTHDLVQSVDAEGNFIFVNRMWCETLGWTPEEARRLNFCDVLRPDMAGHCREVFAMLKQGRNFARMEVCFVSKSGHEITLEGSLTGRFRDGKFLETQSFFRDITARKHAEDALGHERDFSETVIDGLPGIFYLVDPERHLRRWNKNFETVTGYTAAELGRMDAGQLFPLTDLPAVQESFLKVLETGSANVEVLLQPRDGAPVPYFFTGLRVMVGETPCMAGVGIDVSERRRSAALIDGQKQVLELIAKGTPLPESLTALLRVIEAQSPEMLCSILLLDPDGIHVRHGAAPSLPEVFNSAIDGRPIGPSAGSCGTAAFRREPVIVEDIATDPLWAEYRAAALPHGLRACWSTPIFDEKRTVLGTFAIYYRKPGQPDAQHLHYIALTTGLAAIAIGRTRNEAALQKMRFSVDHAGDGVLWVSSEGRVMYANHSGCTRLGYSHDEMLGMTVFDLDPDFQPGAWSLHWEELKRAGTLTFETRQRCKDGRILSVEINANFVQFDGNEFNFAFVRDITERKRVQAQATAVLNSLTAHIAVVDARGIVLAVNEPWLRFARENDALDRRHVLPGVNYLDAVQRATTAGDDLATEALTGIRRVLQGEEDHFELEYPCHSPKERRWFLMIVTPLIGTGGAVLAHEDITARKLAEDAFREAEARLRLAVTASNIGLWDWNLAAGTIFFSREWKSQLGYTEDEIPNRFGQWESRVHPDDLAPTQAKLQRFLEDPAGHYATEIRLRHKDGSYRWIFTQAQLFRDDLGKPVRMLGCHLDLTARKEAEEALRASEEKFGKAFRNSPDAVLLTTLDGHILDANAGFTRLTGYSPEEFHGSSTAELRLWADGADRERFLSALRDHGRVMELDAPFRTRTGELRTCLISGELMDLGGKPAIIGVVRDITERKQAEASLRDLGRRLLRAEDEERRRIAKELHDSTAQDLVAVMMNLGALRDALALLDVKRVQSLDDSIALVENSVNEIRTLSYVLHPPRLDEIGLPGALSEYAAGLDKRADIRIRVEAAEDFGRLPEELEFVLFRVAQESLANAVRHSQSDAATIRLARKDSGIVLEIEDYGRGMPAGNAQEPGAYGVGIAGMRERLQHLGGRLEIQSGRAGTIFRAVLPWKGSQK